MCWDFEQIVLFYCFFTNSDPKKRWLAYWKMPRLGGEGGQNEMVLRIMCNTFCGDAMGNDLLVRTHKSFVSVIPYMRRVSELRNNITRYSYISKAFLWVCQASCTYVGTWMKNGERLTLLIHEGTQLEARQAEVLRGSLNDVADGSRALWRCFT